MTSSQDQDGPSGSGTAHGHDDPSEKQQPVTNNTTDNTDTGTSTPPSKPTPAAQELPTPIEPSAPSIPSEPISSKQPNAPHLPEVDTSEKTSRPDSGESASNDQADPPSAPEPESALAAAPAPPRAPAPDDEPELAPAFQDQAVNSMDPLNEINPNAYQDMMDDGFMALHDPANAGNLFSVVDKDMVYQMHPEFILAQMAHGPWPTAGHLDDPRLLHMTGPDSLPVGFPFAAQMDGPQLGGLESDDEEHDHDQDTYGKLILPDLEHWITTRTVIIGRDVKAYKQIKQEREYERKCEENLAKGLALPSNPPAALSNKYKSSYISNEGGALGPPSDDDEDVRPAKRRKTAAARKVLRQQGDSARTEQQVISSRQYFEHARPVDVKTLRPSSDVVARLNIHGEGPDFSAIYQNTKGISREHLKIQQNSEKRTWEAVVLGRNGVFRRGHDEAEENSTFFAVGAVITLRSGDVVQIQNIPITFSLTGIDDGKTGAESTYSENGKEMSFDFQSSRDDGGEREANMRDTDDESVENREERMADSAVVGSDESENSDEEMEDAPSSDKAAPGDRNSHGAGDEIRETVESDLADERVKPEFSPGGTDALAQLSMPPKKRGPGRPPKNGIMSKREERLLKKQLQEEAKKNMPPQDPGAQAEKRKVGRPRKHPLPEDAEGQSEKRKYKARKSKEDGDEDGDGEKPAKEKSQKHKTPPLELKREDFTEEQLQKPTKNYQMLIDEIMSAAPPKGYSLKQVYKRIQERWPFFYFCVDTKGWESSVRHNLLGSECFKKIDGNWHRVPGVPLESGKKRKPSDSTAESRPAGMYNGYSHPYHPPSHAQPPGHQPIAHSTGLSQPNLPPRFPPNGQAYQIQRGPPPNPAQPGIAPNQQPPLRPGYSQHQAVPLAPQTNGYTAPGAASRPPYQGTQPPPFNPAYGNRPQVPHAANAGAPAPAAGQLPAQRQPMARPGQGPPGIPPHNVQTNVNSANAPRPVLPSAPQQSIPPSAPPAPPGPVVEPAVKTFIRDFRAEVVKQLQASQGKRSGAVAMSVINRGLGMTDRSLVPECEAVERLILNVFHQHKKTYRNNRAEVAAKAAAASAPSTATAPVRPPAANGSGNRNGPTTPVNPRPVGPPAGPSVATSVPASRPSVPPASGPSGASGQTNKPVGPAAGPVPSGGVSGSLISGAVTASTTMAASAATKQITASPTPNTPVIAGTGIATSFPAGSKPSTPAPVGSAAPAPASTAPIPSASANTASAISTPRPAGPVPSPASAAASSIPKPASVGPTPPPAFTGRPSSASASGGAAGSGTAPTGAAPSASATPASTAPKPISIGHAPSVSAATASSTAKPVSVGPAPNAPATTGVAPSVAGPMTAASSTPRPAPGGSAPGLSTNAAPAVPRPATASPTPNTRPAAGMPQGGASKPATSTGVVAAGAGTPNARRAASGTPGTPANEDSKDVELLDPELVALVVKFKKAILPTLAEKLDPILGESLIMSAVDRMLGFTDDTFVYVNTEQQQKNLKAAEETLMQHIETRFHVYLKDRAASSR